MKKKGFTLIEMVVVIAVVALTVPAIFAIVFGLLREQTKIHRLSTVKQNGDFILNTIGTTIRSNALSVHAFTPATDDNAVCRIVESYSDSTLFFRDALGDTFGFSASDSAVTSSSASLGSSTLLNSEKTVVSNFSLSCEKTAAYSPALVSVSFDICYAATLGSCSVDRAEETATLHYQTKIKLRNF